MTTATGANAGEVKAKTLTCAVGYSVTTKDGCFSCSGSATVTGYKSCTTDAKGVVSVPICLDGFYLSGTACSSCTDTTGKIKKNADGTTALPG